MLLNTARLALACAFLLAACGGGDPEPEPACQPQAPVRENGPNRPSIQAPAPASAPEPARMQIPTTPAGPCRL